jgi:hypothetical protein
MFNYNTFSNNYPNSTYGYRNNNYNNHYATSTKFNESTERTTSKDVNSDNNENSTNLKNDTHTRNDVENKFRLGPLTISNEELDIFGFSFAIDDLIIIGLMIIIFLDSDSDFVLLIILGLILFNISFSNLNIF